MGSIQRALVPALVLMVQAIAMACSTVALAGLSPQQQHEVFQEAQQAYDRGVAALLSDPIQARQEFANAAARFQLIADAGGVSGRLLYNFGNAHLQAGDVGRAILNYRRAERLLPGDSRLQHNLHHARSMCRSQIESTARQDLMRVVFSWHERWPLALRFSAFAAVNGGLWLTLIGTLLRPTGAVRWIAVCLAIGWLGLGGSIAAEMIGYGTRVAGVLLSDDVIVRKGNGAGYQPKFDQPLHAGVEFEVLERRGEWLNVRLTNGEEGWIESQGAALVDSNPRPGHDRQE
jgi:hypothetical protein